MTTTPTNHQSLNVGRFAVSWEQHGKLWTAGGDTVEELITNYRLLYGFTKGAEGITLGLPSAPQSVVFQSQGVPYDDARDMADGTRPTCKHGPRVHRTGRSAKGPWAAWFCPQPKGAADTCEPMWAKP